MDITHDPSFSLQSAIQKQVEKEDWISWARTPAPIYSSSVLSKQIHSTPWSNTSYAVFAANVFKKTLNIFLP